MLSAMLPGRTIRPVASARPVAVRAAWSGRRSMLRRAIRGTGPSRAVKPMRSSHEGLKAAGGSGRIASAGGRATAVRTDERVPATQAPVLTASAVPSAR